MVLHLRALKIIKVIVYCIIIVLSNLLDLYIIKVLSHFNAPNTNKNGGKGRRNTQVFLDIDKKKKRKGGNSTLSYIMYFERIYTYICIVTLSVYKCTECTVF